MSSLGTCMWNVGGWDDDTVWEPGKLYTSTSNTPSIPFVALHKPVVMTGTRVFEVAMFGSACAHSAEDRWGFDGSVLREVSSSIMLVLGPANVRVTDTLEFVDGRACGVLHTGATHGTW